MPEHLFSQDGGDIAQLQRYFCCSIFAGSFRCQLIDYFRGHVTSCPKQVSFMLIRTKWHLCMSWHHFGWTLWRSQLLCSWRNFYFWEFVTLAHHMMQIWVKWLGDLAFEFEDVNKTPPTSTKSGTSHLHFDFRFETLKHPATLFVRTSWIPVLVSQYILVYEVEKM